MNDDRVYQVYHGEEGDETTRTLTRMRVHWILDHVPGGRILDIGCSQGIVSQLLAQRGSTVVGLDREKPALDFAERVRSALEPEARERLELIQADAHEIPFPRGSFEHVVCSEVLEHVDDPARVVEEMFRVVVPGGKLIVTVPQGIMPHPDHKRVFYADSLTGLLEPMFGVEKLSELERHLGVVGERRPRARRRPAYQLSPGEVGFLQRERELLGQLDESRSRLTEANLKYRDVTQSIGVDRERAAELEGQVKATRDQLEAAIAELQAARREERQRLHDHRMRRRERRQKARGDLADAVARQDALLGGIEGRAQEIEANLEVTTAILEKAERRRTSTRPPLVARAPAAAPDELERWFGRAAAAPGDEVVFMYSGTIHLQEKRGNRPIRLTRAYLDRGRPVFFNYWRWRADDPGPEWGHPLLFQSPVDLTPTLLDRLLEADFDGKRKLMFASFPHELMVRALSRAAQHGWTTIYDARDDWEEFHKVGMAKWYDPGFEQFLVRHAEVVSAVSRPLARKLGAIGARDDIVVVPNGLDPDFPLPAGAREPADPPVVGYFGHLTPKWFDWDLVVRAATRHPDWRFQLAGHQAPEDLSLPPNIELLGLLGHAQLAELSRRWSFAIIPFKLSSLGEAVDPIKVYEYLHLGLPVLASYMPQMRDYPATAIAESPEDFLALLPSMTGRTFDEEVVRPWLAENTWQVRVDRYSQLAERARLGRHDLVGIESLLGRPPSNGRPGGENGDRPTVTPATR